MSDDSQTTVSPETPQRQCVESLWDIADVAAYLKVVERTIYRWLADGKIPYLRPGGQYRFDPAVIRDWVRTSQLSSTDSEESSSPAAV